MNGGNFGVVKVAKWLIRTWLEIASAPIVPPWLARWMPRWMLAGPSEVARINSLRERLR